MQDILIDIFGAYEPHYNYVTEIVDGVSTSVQEIAPGMAGVDWEWIGAVFLFSICLYSLFRMMGSLFGR